MATVMKCKCACRNYKNRNNGFSLIEVLVVLVIVSLSTGLLTASLSTTWQALSRVSNKQLTQTKTLPTMWLRESVEQMISRHPDVPAFFGDRTAIRFETLNALTSYNKQPEWVQWSIQQRDNEYLLIYSSVRNEVEFEVLHSRYPLFFHFYHDEQWQAEFNLDTAHIPRAVELYELTPNGPISLSLGVPQRDTNPTYPPEYLTFGEYEF